VSGPVAGGAPWRAREAELTPRRIVAELDRHIVGQAEAKRAVAIALRSRLRRRRLDPALAEEVTPKNILMMGPTGVGKTEIARRLARLVGAPFVKVEATRFTEVGYVGRDVESIVRDLAEAAYQLVRAERAEAVREQARGRAEARLVNLLLNPPPPPREGAPGPLGFLFSAPADEPAPSPIPESGRRAEYLARLRAGELDAWPVDVDVEVAGAAVPIPGLAAAGTGAGEPLGDVLRGLLPKRRERRHMSVAEAREVLTQEEIERAIDAESVAREAVRRAEDEGIVFLDELDKVAQARTGPAIPDVSREGVQRDLLPIVEGTTVTTRYGPVRTDHVLFIGAGAFHAVRPSDLIPELQGRFPIRVELTSLRAPEFERILTEPESSLTRQYQALLATDGVHLAFAPDGVAALARYAEALNERLEDIGARRLHALIERVLERASFAAPEEAGAVTVDGAYVEAAVADLVEDRDVARFIL
jgi:ATP-dependent HslUV protease ATP-binding subunit HslU